MQYVSTRGQSPSVDFEQALLNGLAPDGGLYVPKSLPFFDPDKIESLRALSYQDLAFEVIQPFVGGCISDESLKEMINETYSNDVFRHPSIAPLVQTNQQEWVMELFRGPTLAFKDFALQLLGRLLDFALEKRGEKGVILGATSGDTGSAAIEGCRHSKHLKIFILHPHNRVSEVQRLQMTSVLSDNVFNIAVEGNFDDCQAMVKASFADQSFLKEDVRLLAVNSINWARIMAQIVYYFQAVLSLGAKGSVHFSVPTGNFGDIYAGFIAKRMGLPIGRLVVATNQNDILYRFVQQNDYSKDALHKTLSPSMDIMVSSNFERLLYDLHDADGEAVKSLMDGFQRGEPIKVDASVREKCLASFDACAVSDEKTCETIAKVYQESDYLLDPHSAIGLAASRTCLQDYAHEPSVVLATAHPAKFEEAIRRAGVTVDIPLPSHLNDLMSREERFEVLPNELAAVKAFVSSHH